MDDAYLHFPTFLDWIEHGLAFIGAGWVGWYLRGRWSPTGKDET